MAGFRLRIGRFGINDEESTTTLQNQYESSDLINYWGSAEEYEVETFLQGIISNGMNYGFCTQTLQELRLKLIHSSTGWVDRFVISQGIEVLHKLLADVYAGEPGHDAERELILVQCLSLLYQKSFVAQQMVSEKPTDKITKTLLRGLLSPCEETRTVVSLTVRALKTVPGSPSKVLHTLTLTRHFRVDLNDYVSDFT